jgi:hypothetical protein
VIGEIHDVNAFCTDLGEISKMFRQARLAGDKLVEAEKTNRKNAILSGAKAKWSEHIAGLNARLGNPYMPEIQADFALAIKGLKNMASMQNAVDTLLAKSKIAANEVADKIESNLRTMRELAANHAFLFSDTATIVLKANDDLTALVKMRISEHDAAEAKRLEAEREKIREEEQAKAQREAEANVAAAELLAKQEQAATAQAAKAIEAAKAEEASDDAASAKCIAPIIAAEIAARRLPEIQNGDGITDQPAETGSLMKLGEICQRLGFTVTADFLAALEFHPVKTEKAAKLYKESAFPAICAAIVRNIQAVASQPMKLAA